MAITDESNNGFYMPVAPAYSGNNGGMFGGMGGDWFAWFILVLLIGGNGWGMGGFGMGGMMPWLMGMGGGMGAGYGLDYLYPWLNNSQHISDGFRDQALQTSINGLQNSVTSGFGDVQLGIAGINQNLCQTGNAITGAISNGFSSAEIAANGRQMANMQQGFALQSAVQNGFATGAAATADLKYTVATEACNDRAAVSNALNALLTHIDQKVQGVQDKLCQLELDGVKNQVAAKDDIIAQLRQENLYARGQASQIAQNATIIDGVYDRLSRCPVGSTPVYGNTPIFTCQRPNTCGCPGNAFVA